MTSTKRDLLIAFLRERVSERVSVPIDEIDLDTNLVSIGMRSLDAVLISGQLEDEFQVEIDPILMFEFSTIGEVVANVLEKIEPA